MNFWLPIWSAITSFFKKKEEKECLVCEQLKIDLAYERGQSSLYRELLLEEKSKRPAEPQRSIQNYPIGSARRGGITISGLKQKAQIELERQARERLKEGKIVSTVRS